MDKLETEEKQPALDNNQTRFKWIPRKEIEDFQHDPFIQQVEEEPNESQANEK